MAVLLCHILRIAPGAASGLHEEAKQPLWRAVVAGVQSAVGLHGGNQCDASEVMALGHHLRADQHIYVACMHLGQLLFQAALGLGGVGIDAAHTGGVTVGALHIAQQAFQLFLQLLRALAQRHDVGVAAGRAGKGYALRKAAVVAAQGAVAFVKDLVRAAMRAVALPAAVGTKQHGRKATAVEQDQALLAALYALGNRVQQRWGEHRALGLLGHVYQAHLGQAGRTNTAGHIEAQVAARASTLFGRAGMPALKRWRGAAQNHLGAHRATTPQGQVSGGVTRAFLLLVAGVMLLIDDDQCQLRYAGKDGHTRAQHNARAAGVGGQPAFQALRVSHAAVHADHGIFAVLRRKAGDKALFQLGREIDLGHHHQRLRFGVGIQHGLHGAQIDLGLAATGAAVEQKWARLLLNLLKNQSLLCAKCY